MRFKGRIFHVILWCAVGLAQVTALSSVHAGTLDERGMLHLDPASIVRFGFEDASEFPAIQALVADSTGQVSALQNAALQTTDNGALEGNHTFLVNSTDAGATYVLGFNIDAASIAGKTVEVRAWVRSSRRFPRMSLLYGANAEADDLNDLIGVLTGRQTSDGWIELSSGPVEAQVLGATLNGVRLVGGPFEVDAIEVASLGAARVPVDMACTGPTQDDVCGDAGACWAGRCVDAAAVWGVPPYTAAQREDYAHRMAFYFKTLSGGRDVAARAAAKMDALVASALAMPAPKFMRGMAQLQAAMEDGHAFGRSKATSFNVLLPSFWRTTAGMLRACLGLVDLDLLGGGNGFAVFKTVAGSNSQLRPGDVLHRVDGQSVDAFLAWAKTDFLLQVNDPGANPAHQALELAALLGAQGSSLEFLRCESPTSCQNPTTVTLNLGDDIRALALQGSVPNHYQDTCDGRLVAAIPDAVGHDNSGTPLNWTRDGDTLLLQFDGTSGSWSQSVGSAFAVVPTKILVDARYGEGGNLAPTASLLVSQLRDPSLPVWMALSGRPWDNADAHNLIGDNINCADFSVAQPYLLDRCNGVIAEQRNTGGVAPNAKVAWLHAFSSSANDMVLRFMDQRPNYRLFGPGSSSGNDGEVGYLPPLLPSEALSGTLQTKDAVFATSKAGLATASWGSGHGVIPDDQVTQKLSDTLAGVDTLLARARAWLGGAP